MINSMTGYGDAEGQLDGVTYIVEIKGVNNRYFKPRIKLPESVAFLEEDIYELLRHNIDRGTIDFVLRLKNVSADMLYAINESALKAYLTKLSDIASSKQMNCPIDVGGLLNLPGVLEPLSPEEEKASRVKKLVLDISKEALEQLKQMRKAEGAELEADLVKHCNVIKERLETIKKRKNDVMQEYHEKLKQRVEELTAGARLKLDEDVVAREVAVFADRSDISEEIARLESHLKQFEDSCKSQGQSGRRLEFLAQEMLREANTTASKAGDVDIAHCVVDIKCSIDRLKEQVQNVE